MKRSELLAVAANHYTKNERFELEHAIDVATEYHKGQKRRSGENYIGHCLSVASTLIEWGMDIDTVLAGVLHDTVEDTELTLDKIESLFGHDVAFLVDGVTKVSQARAGMRDLGSYLPSTTDNLSKLLIAVGHDIRVVIIKLADRLHNLQTLKYMPEDKQRKIARESLEVFAPMADRLGMGRVRTQIEELAFCYLDPKGYKKLRKLMKDRQGKSHRKLAVVRKEVTEILNQNNIKHTLDGRIKGIYSLKVKLDKVDGNIDDVYDLIALRVIVQSPEVCYQTLGLLHNLYQPMLGRIKDYIAAPKPNGYQSLHTTVITPAKEVVEFQVRTHEMHDYAERGLAASFHYHDQKKTPSYTKRKSSTLPAQLQWISQMQEVASKLREGSVVSLDQLKIDLFANRIFVYSPKGDIYNLPEGAFPLDFAYAVHSDLGNHASGFKVNGKINPFDKPLHNGDIVEVLTKRLSTVKKDWFKYVTTSHARNKLKSQLNKSRLALPRR